MSRYIFGLAEKKSGRCTKYYFIVVTKTDFKMIYACRYFRGMSVDVKKNELFCAVCNKFKDNLENSIGYSYRKRETRYSFKKKTLKEYPISAAEFIKRFRYKFDKLTVNIDQFDWLNNEKD